jgi:hypothetical protein
MSWKDLSYCDRNRLIICPRGHGVNWEADRAAGLMRLADEDRIRAGKEPIFYTYGDHVSDPLAVIKRYLKFVGYKDALGDSDLRKMWCPGCTPKDQDGQDTLSR